METFFFYLKLGLNHITDLNGYDHLLFIVAVACFYTIKDSKKLVYLLTAFTLGHSITLGLAATKLIHFSSEIAEIIIPFTILVTSILNLIKLNKTQSKETVLYIVITIFGLIHGLGFSTYFSAILGNEESVVFPLLSFNIGLEIGQIIIVLIFLVLREMLSKMIQFKHIESVIFLSGGTAMVSFILFLEHLSSYLTK
jgi:hydrogenase/urease accessory protein HupE